MSAAPAVMSSPETRRRVKVSPGRTRLVAPGAEEAQQEKEQVDEIEIEREGAHDRAPGDPIVRRDRGHRLQPLGIPGRQPGEDENAHDRDAELKSRRSPEE